MNTLPALSREGVGVRYSAHGCAWDGRTNLAIGFAKFGERRTWGKVLTGVNRNSGAELD